MTAGPNLSHTGPWRLSRAGLWIPPAVVAGLILLSSSLPQTAARTAAPDWLLHFLAYTVLSVLTCRALAGGLGPPVGFAPCLAGAAASALYGLMDEVHQAFVPGRFAEVRDFAADAAGAGVGAGLVLLLGGRRRAGRPRMTLYTRGNCHLCEDAKVVLENEKRRGAIELDIVDIDSDPNLARRFGSQVPVAYLDGRKAFKFRVDPARLRKRLDRLGRARRARGRVAGP